MHKKYTEGYPLCWPENQSRTVEKKKCKYRLSYEDAKRELWLQIDKLGEGAFCVGITSNMRLKANGAPYKNDPIPEDTGAAVHFIYNGKFRSIGCDVFETVEKNICGLRDIIKSYVMLQRNGFAGIAVDAFTELNRCIEYNPEGPNWWEALQVEREASYDVVKKQYLLLRKQYHSDTGENPDSVKLSEVMDAWKIYEKLYAEEHAGAA